MRAALFGVSLSVLACGTTVTLADTAPPVSHNAIDTYQVDTLPLGINGTNVTTLNANGFGFGGAATTSLEVWNEGSNAGRGGAIFHGNGNGTGPDDTLMVYDDGNPHIEAPRATTTMQIGTYYPSNVELNAAGGNVFINSLGSGNVEIHGNNGPLAPLDVDGEIKIGNTGLPCDGAHAGAIRYVSGTGMQYCSGTAWAALTGHPILIGGCMANAPACPAGYYNAGVTSSGKYSCDEYGPNVWITELCDPN